MKNFKNSKTAKFVSGFVGLSVAAMMMGPSLASAATVEELTAQINALLAQVSALQAATGNSTATPAACAYTFAQTLKVGVSSDEVMNLQKVLNMSADTQVAATGVGSKGMETKYFGAMTKAAVIKFQEKYAADILTPVGLTKGTGLVGASTRAKLNAMCTTTTTPTTPTTTGSSTVSGSVSATLDTMSPAAGSVIKGASTKVAIFKLTNTGSAAAKVTSVKMKRTGVSSDSTLNNVYLYNGDSRLTDAASVATGVINFSDTAGIVTIPANSSIALGVMVEVSSAANVSETIGVMLTDVTADGVAVAGLPISGAQQTVVAAPSGMATIAFNTNTLPLSSSNVDPQADYVVWQNSVSVGSRDALLSSIRFRQLGSVSTSDLKNFRLMVDGTQVGTAVESVNSNQYVEFTFATPVTMKAGTRVVKLVADIVGGSNKTFAFSVQRLCRQLLDLGQDVLQRLALLVFTLLVAHVLQILTE
jgi:peptidoglycan hydrolase-like protein with peptidoglycan-binding domain